MCLTNIKNIGDIYYLGNWDNLYNETNFILIENGPTRELILILSFKDFKKKKLYQYSYVNFLEFDNLRSCETHSWSWNQCETHYYQLNCSQQIYKQT